VRIVLTGATGFIGSHLVPSLADRHEVIAIVRDEEVDVPGATCVYHDLREPLTAARLPSAVDAVVHLAQSRRYREFPAGAEDVFSLNVRATFELLDYARAAGAERFVFTSTGGVYGHGEEEFVEDDDVNPINFYLASKHAAETLIGPYTSELHAIVLRPFFVYGPGQGPMLVSSLARRVLAGEPVTIDGDPGIRVNPLYVDDAVAVLERSLVHDGSLLCNVAGEEVVDLTGLVGRVARIANVSPIVEHGPAAHAGDIVGDTKRMKTELGFVPEVSLDEGLRRLVVSLGDPGARVGSQ
jgi:UDP-glucose 4-epimerase